MPIKPPPSKHTIEKLGNKTIISIPTPKQWLLLLLLGFWSAGWTLAVFDTIRELTREIPNEINWGIVFWFVGYTIGGLAILSSYLWLLFGREVIEVNGQSLTISRNVLGIRLPKEYSVEHIKDLRTSSITNNLRRLRAYQLWGYNSGSVAFDYRSRTLKFASGVDEIEAKQIVDEIKIRYPQYKN
jgi:hypothetical protein